MTARPQLILDTDLGTDVDDALALAMLLDTDAAADLLAVTTVYGDTALRARLARRYARLAGQDIVVHAGERDTLSGKDVWWAGHEGTLHGALEAEDYETEGAVSALVRTVLARPGQVDVLAIGPLTNVAAAILRDAAFAPAVRHLWIMGGAFDTERTEHNFRSDSVAADIVFRSGISTSVIGLEQTQRIELRADQISRIAAAGELGAALDRDIRQWWAFWNETWNVPHDPVVVLALLQPSLFAWSAPGRVEVVVSGAAEDDGLARFVPDPAGTVRLATGFDADEVAERIVRAVVAGCA
jgi:purine nucleosidase